MPLVEQEVVLGQRRVRQEPDPVARMAEMLKDLQQEIRLLKESRTQEIRDNVPPVVNQDKAQLAGGSAVGGGGNPQYLTLLTLMLFWSKKGKSSQGSPNSFLGIPHSHKNS